MRFRYSFNRTLLAIVAVAAIASLIRIPRFGIASTTKVDNLSIAGTTDGTGSATFHSTFDATGAITENGSRVFSAVGTGMSSTGRTVNLNMAGGTCTGNQVVTSGSSTGTLTCSTPPTFTTSAHGYVPSPGSVAGKVLSDNGSWISLTPAGSLTVVNAALPGGTVNFTTEGSIDWFAPTAFLDAPRQLSLSNASNSKKMGGWIRESFDWNWVPEGLNNGTAASQARTVNTGDNINGATTLTANTTAPYLWSGSTSPSAGWGYTFRVPATNTQRVLRIYTFYFSLNVIVTAHLSDGSAADASTTFSAASGAGGSKMVTITYKASTPGAELSVSVLAGAFTRSDPNLGFAGATLGTI